MYSVSFAGSLPSAKLCKAQLGNVLLKVDGVPMYPPVDSNRTAAVCSQF